MPSTTLYLTIVSRVLSARVDPGLDNIQVSGASGTPENHLLPRVLPEMAWMPRFNRTISVSHPNPTPNDNDVRSAIQSIWNDPPPPDAQFSLGSNVFAAAGTRSYWVEGRWVLPESGADLGYVAAFQILFAGSSYYQSILYGTTGLLRTDYLLLAQALQIAY